MVLSTSVGVSRGSSARFRALAAHHEVHLGDVHALLPPAQADRKLLVHLHDDRLGLLHHGAGGGVEEREVEVAVLVHGRRGQHADVDFQRLAIVPRLVAIEQRDVMDEPLIAQAPVQAAEVPAHERERLVLRVRRHHGERAQRQHPADLDVAKLALARRERPVERLWDAVAEGVLHPVPGADNLDGFFRGPLFGVVLVHRVHRGASPSRGLMSGRRPATVVESHLLVFEGEAVALRLTNQGPSAGVGFGHSMSAAFAGRPRRVGCGRPKGGAR